MGHVDAFVLHVVSTAHRSFLCPAAEVRLRWGSKRCQQWPFYARPQTFLSLLALAVDNSNPYPRHSGVVRSLLLMRC